MPETTKKQSKTGWAIAALGDVVNIINQYWDRDTTVPERLVAGEHIDEGDLRVRHWAMTDDDLIPPTFNRWFQAGDVLLHSRNIKKVARPDFGGITGEKLFILRSKDESVLLQAFVPFLIQSEVFRAYAESRWAGSTNKFLNKEPLQVFEFALPPIEEQRRIVALLESTSVSANRMRAAYIAAVQLLYTLQKSVFESRQHYVHSLSSLAEVRLGRQRSPKYQTGPHLVPYLRAANIKDGYLDLTDVLKMNFTPSEQEVFRLANGDILVTEGCGSLSQVGANAVWNSDLPGTVCFQNTVLRLRATPGAIKPELLSHWAAYAFKTGAFASVARGTGIFHIGSSRCEEMRLRVPRYENQDAVLGLLDAALSRVKRLKSRSNEAWLLHCEVARRKVGGTW